MSATPIGLIPIGNEPVWLMAYERSDADTMRLTLRRERTYVLAVRPQLTAEMKELARLELPKLRAAIAERDAQPAMPGATGVGVAG